MSLPTWGQLQKAQDDPTTIDQEIDNKIQDHLANADAHALSGESLETHKSQAIIDHLAASIVEDKIRDLEISPPKRKWSQFTLESMFESLDGYHTYTEGSGAINHFIGTIAINTGATSGSAAYVIAESWDNGWGPSFTKDPRFMTQAYLFYGTAQTALIKTGNENGGFGFKLVDDVLYAIHTLYNNGSPIDYTTQIIASISSGWHKLAAIMTSGTKIEFYIGNTLIATHTTNLPSSAEANECDEFMRYEIHNSAAAQKSLIVRNFNFTQEE